MKKKPNMALKAGTPREILGHYAAHIPDKPPLRLDDATDDCLILIAMSGIVAHAMIDRMVEMAHEELAERGVEVALVGIKDDLDQPFPSSQSEN